MDENCRCQIVGWSRDPYEPHIPAQAEWEQADDCPVHPLQSTFAQNSRILRHEAETPMRGHDDDGTCCRNAKYGRAGA